MGFYLEHGADGFTVLDVAGEAAKLTPAEARAVAERFVRCSQGKSVVVGVSNSSLAQLTELTISAMDLGAPAS